MEKGKVSTWLSNHGEWASLMTTMIVCFLFCFHKSEKTNDRLDAHMIAINQRTDDLHKEFYDLLKQMQAERNRG